MNRWWEAPELVLTDGPQTPQAVQILDRIHKLSRSEHELLLQYVSQLTKWQTKTNLPD